MADKHKIQVVQLNTGKSMTYELNPNHWNFNNMWIEEFKEIISINEHVPVKSIEFKKEVIGSIGEEGYYKIKDAYPARVVYYNLIN